MKLKSRELVWLILLGLLFCPGLALAQTFDGNNDSDGGDGTSWEDPLNWDGDLLPTGNTNIGDGFSVTLGSAAAIGELDVSGDQTSGDGTLTHSAGALTGSNWAKIGTDGGDTGTYNLSGTASASGFSNVYVGRESGNTGNMSISDTASFTAAFIAFGENGGTGNLDISGGSLNNTGGEIRFENDSTADVLGGAINVGSLPVRNSAVVTQQAGAVSAVDPGGNAGGWVSIGNDSSATAKYNLSGGSLSSNNDWISVGENGGGELNVSGASSVTSTGNGLIVGRNGSGDGLLSLTGSAATVDVPGLRVGIDSDGNAGGIGSLDFTADGGGVSAIIATGDVWLNDGTGTGTSSLTVDMSSAPSGDILLIDVGGTLSGTFAGLSQGASVPGSGGRFIDYTYGDGNNIALVIPEPATGVLLLGGLAASFYLRRRNIC